MSKTRPAQVPTREPLRLGAVGGALGRGVYATLPPDAPLVNGIATFSVTLNTAGSATLTAADITDPSKAPNTGSSTTVTP